MKTAASFSPQNCAMESMPFLPSIDSIATRIRIYGLIWIRTRPPTTPDPSRQDPMRRRPLTRFVSCHAGLAVQSCTPEQRLTGESAAPRKLGLAFQNLLSPAWRDSCSLAKSSRRKGPLRHHTGSIQGTLQRPAHSPSSALTLRFSKLESWTGSNPSPIATEN